MAEIRRKGRSQTDTRILNRSDLPIFGYKEAEKKERESLGWSQGF